MEQNSKLIADAHAQLAEAYDTLRLASSGVYNLSSLSIAAVLDTISSLSDFLHDALPISTRADAYRHLASLAEMKAEQLRGAPFSPDHLAAIRSAKQSGRNLSDLTHAVDAIDVTRALLILAPGSPEAAAALEFTDRMLKEVYDA